MFFAVTLVVLFLDVLLKILANRILSNAQTLPLINNFLHLTYIENYGSAFGFFRDQRLFLTLIGIIVCALVIYIYQRSSKRDNVIGFSFGLILGGSLGNLINRISMGYVIDYVDFRMFPVFNLADVAINIGVAILMVEIFIRGKECFR